MNFPQQNISSSCLFIHIYSLFPFSAAFRFLKPLTPSQTFHFLLLSPFLLYVLSPHSCFPLPKVLFPLPSSLFSHFPLFLFLSYRSLFYNLLFLINKTKSILILTNMEKILLREKPFSVNIGIDPLY